MIVRRFQNTNVGHNKFWEVHFPDIALSGTTETHAQTVWGRIGTDGTITTKQFHLTTQAVVWAQKKIKEKLAKGYIETTLNGEPMGAPIPPMQETANSGLTGYWANKYGGTANAGKPVVLSGKKKPKKPPKTEIIGGKKKRAMRFGK